jgi:hypothetical protein
MDKLRIVGLWFVVIAAFVAVQLFADFVGRLAGVPTILDVDPYTVDYGRGAESEVSSITTTFGWGFNILSVLAAISAWHLIQGKRGSHENEGFFIGWLVGAAILIVGGIPLWKLSSGGAPALVVNVLDLSLIAGAWYAGYRIWQNSKTAL